MSQMDFSVSKCYSQFSCAVKIKDRYLIPPYLYIFTSITNRLHQPGEHIREHGPRKRYLEGPEHLEGPACIVP